MSRSLGVAVIGAGLAGRAHIAGYRSASTTLCGPDLPEIRLVAVADAYPGLADATAARFGYARGETDWKAVPEADDIDVVSVVVADHLHREMVEGPLAAGKHVLCEKPMAPTVADAEAQVVAARAFLEPVAGVGELPPVPSFAHGLRNLRLRGAVVESAHSGGAEVAVPATS